MISYTRRVNVDNKYKNNCIDYYVDCLKDKYNILVLEEPTWSIFDSNNAHNNPVYTENIYFCHPAKFQYTLKKQHRNRYLAFEGAC